MPRDGGVTGQNSLKGSESSCTQPPPELPIINQHTYLTDKALQAITNPYIPLPSSLLYKSQLPFFGVIGYLYNDRASSSIDSNLSCKHFIFILVKSLQYATQSLL